MTFDGFKRLSAVVEDPEGLSLATRFEYDANGNLANRYDPLNHRAGFEYDELGRKTQEIQEKGTGSLFTKYTKYDGEGNLKEMFDSKERVFRYDRNELLPKYLVRIQPTPT